MELVSLNDIAIAKGLESTDPRPFEAIILGTLIVAENPHPLYSILAAKISSKMFSKELQPIANIIFDMIETMQPNQYLRKYKILEAATDAKIELSSGDIDNLVHQHAESSTGEVATEEDFARICVVFVEKWYQFSLKKNGLIFAQDLAASVSIDEAYRAFDDRKADIEKIKAGSKDEDYSVYAAAKKHVEIVKKRFADPYFFTGLRTGILKFDRMTGGFEGGDLVGICGFSGEGKTTVTFQMVSHISEQEEVDVYSLETAAVNLAAKSVSMQTGVSTINAKVGKVTAEDIELMENSLLAIMKQRLNILTNFYHIDELERQITLRVRKFGVSCVVIDNLTIIRHNYGNNRDLADTMITYRLKELAMKLNIPIILIVHQNKDSVSRADATPRSGDMKFAGGGVAFDLVVFPYTPKTEATNDPFALEIETSLVITKNRNGGLKGSINMIFVANYGMYCEINDYDGSAILPSRNKVEKTEQSENKPLNIITKRGNPDEVPF